jgi:hypothetical protein
MDNVNGDSQGKKEWQSTISPSTTIFFINNELVRVVHSNRANNIVVVYNYIQNKDQTLLLSDFKKHRKRAYTVIDTARIFKRTKMQLQRWIDNELIHPPMGAGLDGKREFRRLSYYSEDDLFTIRSVLATIHKGRPRKDGRITPRKDLVTEKELRSLIGDSIMLYTKTEDGRFIPVWQEETW